LSLGWPVETPASFGRDLPWHHDLLASPQGVHGFHPDDPEFEPDRAEVRTPFTEAALQSRQIDAIITQDPGHLVRSAIRILRARKDRREILGSQEKIRIEILIKENI
jgi:hypothetical protein